MKSILLFSFFIIFLTKIECSFQKKYKFEEISNLDQKVKAKIQNAISSLPLDKIPKEFKEPKDDKFDLYCNNILNILNSLFK
jgi:hypothetical protein